MAKPTRPKPQKAHTVAATPKPAEEMREHPNGAIVDLGDSVRVERAFRPQTDPRDPNQWKLDEQGQPVYAWGVYDLVQVEGGKHPVHGKETTEADVWVKRSEHDTREKALVAAGSG
jgi:hypothetical protein